MREPPFGTMVAERPDPRAAVLELAVFVVPGLFTVFVLAACLFALEEMMWSLIGV